MLKRFRLRSLLYSWEFYLLLLVATFLRLYLLNTTEFDADQAMIFAMARYALNHNLLIATSNFASIGILNPPGVEYLLLLPARISGDPLAAACFVALCAVAAVLLTYLFARRYYGRLVATISAFIYATAAQPVYYARFTWNQNLLPLFLLLFLFCLFWGVVERRRGWFAPALALLGLLVQLHATGAMMIPVFLLAWLLAPSTVRWRDIAWGLAALLLIYSPYLLWESASHFSDLPVLFSSSGLRSQIDSQSWEFYQHMLAPYTEPYTNTGSLLYKLLPFLFWLRHVNIALLIAGALFACIAVAGLFHSEPHREISSPQNHSLQTAWCNVREWVKALRANPQRCGLLLVLAWQIVPVLAMTRHSLPIYAHYFIITMPGQFLLIGIFLADVSAWFQKRKTLLLPLHLIDASAPSEPIGGQSSRLRFVCTRSIGMLIPCLLAALIIIAQMTGTVASVRDTARGKFVDSTPNGRYYNSLNSLQNALQMADTLAQQQHFSHVYISADPSNSLALQYLLQSMHTPTTLFEGSNCLLLPAASDGPAVLLVSPYNNLVGSLATTFGGAALVAQPVHPGGSPFHLYIVNAPTEQATIQGTFSHNLQLLSPLLFRLGHTPLLVSRWLFPRSLSSPSDLATTTYTLRADPDGGRKSCTFTSVRAEDQLLLAFKTIPAHSVLTFTGQYQISLPSTFSWGPFAFLTGATQISSWGILRTSQGAGSISVPANHIS